MQRGGWMAEPRHCASDTLKEDTPHVGRWVPRRRFTVVRLFRSVERARELADELSSARSRVRAVLDR